MPLYKQIKETQKFIDTQLREFTHLGTNGEYDKSHILFVLQKKLIKFKKQLSKQAKKEFALKKSNSSS